MSVEIFRPVIVPDKAPIGVQDTNEKEMPSSSPIDLRTLIPLVKVIKMLNVHYIPLQQESL